MFFFASVGKEMNANFKKQLAVGAPNTSNIEKYSPKFYLGPVSEAELVECISTLKTGSSPGHDDVSVEFIKMAIS